MSDFKNLPWAQLFIALRNGSAYVIEGCVENGHRAEVRFPRPLLDQLRQLHPDPAYDLVDAARWGLGVLDEQARKAQQHLDRIELLKVSESQRLVLMSILLETVRKGVRPPVGISSVALSKLCEGRLLPVEVLDVVGRLEQAGLLKVARTRSNKPIPNGYEILIPLVESSLPHGTLTEVQEEIEVTLAKLVAR